MARGVSANQEHQEGVAIRDIRPLGQRFSEFLETTPGSLMLLTSILLIMWRVPQLMEIVFLIGMFLFYRIGSKKFSLPFRLPATSRLRDINDPMPGRSIPGMADGIAFLGNELNTNRELWFKADDMKTHLLVFGSTGAGKTETLISLAFNTLVQGSGFIYVDGKGDNGLWAKIFSVVRSVGREDDLLVINYMTGGRDVFGPQKNKLSNTLNPFISGSSGGLTELLVGLMDEAGGDNAMWKGRAISLVSGVMMALVWLRDNDGLLLDVDVIRDYLILDNIQKLAKRRDLPPNILQSINAYLKSLPGYQANAPKQSETVMDQHGYLQMQFTKILGSLSDTYGYIFRTKLGEVDFFDVVVNRRILVVLLPALEKSIDELSNLGKIIVASLKSMMATGLGDSLEGDYADVIDIKPTNSPAPYMCILDEYGYYVVKGAAVMPAQARSLGFSMVFAGQDYPAFQKNNMKEEAISTIGNCNIKIFMKVEDPTDTYKLFEDSVGEALVSKTSGYQNQSGILAQNYMDGGNTVLEKRKRGDLLDLKDQREGEAHIIFKSTLVRAKMFYAQPEKVPKLQLNYFLKVEPPLKEEIVNFQRSVSELTKQLLNAVFMKDIADSCEKNVDLLVANKIFEDSFEKTGSQIDAGIAVVLAAKQMLYSSMDEFSDEMDQLMKEQDSMEKISIFRDDLNDDDEEDDEEEDYSPYGMGIMESRQPFLNENKTREQFREIERIAGSDFETSQIHSNQLIEDMKKAAEYPRTKVPEERGPDDIIDCIKELEDAFDED